MTIRSFLATIFILILSTQVLPIKGLNCFMQDTSTTLVEEVNEKPCSSGNNLNELEEHHVIGYIPSNILSIPDVELIKNYYIDFSESSIPLPYIEKVKLPPNSI